MMRGKIWIRVWMIGLLLVAVLEAGGMMHPRLDSSVQRSGDEPYLINLSRGEKVPFQAMESGIATYTEAPSEIALAVDDGADGVTILYHAFDRGRLQGRIDASTQVAYDLFTSEPELLALPEKIQARLVDRLLMDPEYEEAARLYDRLLRGDSTDSVRYRRLLVRLAKRAAEILSREERALAAERFASEVRKRLNASPAPSSAAIDYDRTVIDMTRPPKRHTRFGLFGGMSLDVRAIDNDPVHKAVKFDFYTTSSLWYAVTTREAYADRGFVNDLLDPNLIDPLDSGMIGKGYDEKKSTMPIANFDGDLKQTGTAKSYVAYRSKSGALWDAPFILNTIAVIDVIADLSSGLKLAQTASKGLNKLQKSIKDYKESLEKDKKFKWLLFALQATYEFGDALAVMAGADVTTVDQRYGQIRLLVDKFVSVMTPDPITMNRERKALEEFAGHPEAIRAVFGALVAKFLKRKKKGEAYSGKLAANSNIWKGLIYYNLWYQTFSAIGESFPNVLKEIGIRGEKKRQAFYRDMALAQTMKMRYPRYKMTAKELKQLGVMGGLLKSLLASGRSELLYRAAKPEWLLGAASSVKAYVMSMISLSKSFNTDSVIGVVSDVIWESIKKTADAKAIMEEVAANIVLAVTPASWYRILRGANKGGAMVWDLVTKPTAYAFEIERLSRKKMAIREIVPPAFAPVSYLDTKEHGMDKEIWTVAPRDYVRKSGKKRRLQALLGGESATSLLVFPGFTYSMENDALIQEEDLAEAYFDKHEDDKVVFADWHVYRHTDYRELKVPKRTEATAFKGNYFRFSAIGDAFNCIDDYLCWDEEERYDKGDGNAVLDAYLRNVGKDEIGYFGFTRMFEDAGHAGDVTHRTPGVYTDSTHLWIGNRIFARAPVQYKAEVKIYVANDYRQHQLTDEVDDSLRLTAVYGPTSSGTCGEADYAVEQTLQDIFAEMTLPSSRGVHRYRLYLRQRDSGSYFGPIEIVLPQKGSTRVRLSLAEMPGLMSYLRKTGVREGWELRDAKLKLILVDDIVTSFFDNTGRSEKLYDLMDEYWGSKGTKRNPMITFWPNRPSTVIKDSDGDGLPDGWEEEHGLDPADCSDGAADNDDDNLSNLQEYVYGTDLNDPDSDGDGLPDGWEVKYRLDPTDPADADLDEDGDGYTNLEEYIAGTNPRSRRSHPDDTHPPVITILGANPISLNVGEKFVDPGATAEDDVDGEVPVRVLRNTVNTSKVGEYEVVYGARDRAGNEANATRRVIVAEVDLAKGLVAHYAFEGNANDSSGNGNNGTEHGGVEYVDGVIGKAAKFDGMDDYIWLGSSQKFNPVKTTISAWINPTSIRSDLNGYIYRWRLYGVGVFVNDGYLCFMGYTNNNAKKEEDENLIRYKININEWVHLVYMYTGSQFEVYINGIKVHKLNKDGNLYYESGGAAIGRDGDYGDDYFNGLIDDLRIYNRALNEAEIEALYKQGAGDLAKGLVAHYTFDGDATDSSGNGNHGVEYGGVEYVDGVIGKAAKFDGVDGYIDVAHNAMFEVDRFTLSAWVNVDPDSNYDAILLKGRYNGDSSNNQREYELKASYGSYYGTRWNSVRLTEAAGAQTWDLVTLVFDGEQLKIYKNGVFDSSTETTEPINRPPEPASLTIGSAFDVENGSLGNRQQALKGMVDDLRIYNRPLSDREIRRLYEMGR